MPSVGTAYVNIRISTKDFNKQLDAMMKGLSTKMEKAGADLGKDFERGLAKTDPFKPLVDNSNKATTALSNNNKKISDSFDRAMVNMSDGADVGVDGLRKVQSQADTTRGSIGKLGQTASGARSSLSGLGSGGGSAGAGLRSAGDGASSASSWFDKLAASAKNNRTILSRLFDTAAFGGTALAGLAAGASAAAQGIFAIASNAAAAAPALAVAANGMLAMAQAGAVLKIGTAGVGAALKAGFADVQKTAVGAAGATKGLGDATGAAARAVRDAKDALQDAYRDAARAAEDAARRTADAERALATAQRASAQAQRELNLARAEAIEQMEDIAFAAEEASLSEERAKLSLADAQQALAAVSELAPDDRSRVEAELAFQEAELRMRQARDSREDADKDQRKIAKTGIEGTDAMKDARNNLADAHQNEADATRDLNDARREEARTAEDNAERIADAQQAVADAQKGLTDAQKKGTAAMTAATTAANAFDVAMGKLGTNQQKFVRRIMGMQGAFQDFKNDIAEPVFGHLLNALDTIEGSGLVGTIKDGLIGTSDALGLVAEEAAKVAASKTFQRSLGNAMDFNNEAIGNFGGAAVNLAEAFVAVADAAGPLFVKFSEWIEGVTGDWATKATGDVGGLRDTIETAGDRVEEFWNLATSLWDTLVLVGGAANDAANDFGDFGRKGEANKDKFGYITSLADSVDKFNENLGKGDGKIGDFDQALKNLNAAGAAFKTVIVDPLISLGQDPDLEAAFNKIAESDAFSKLADTAGDAVPELVDLVLNVADFFAAISETGSIDNFLAILSTVVEKMAEFAGYLSDTKTPDWMTSIIDGFGDIASKLSGIPFLGFLENLDKIDTEGKSVLRLAGYITAAWAAWRILKKGLAIGTSPLVGLVDGAHKFTTGIRDGVGGFKDNWKEARKGEGVFKTLGTKAKQTLQNIGTRFTNMFRQTGKKKELPFPKAPKEAIPTTDSAEKAKAEAAGRAVGTAYAEGLRLGQAKITAQLEAMEAAITTSLTTMKNTLKIEGEGVGLSITQGISNGLTVGEADVLSDAARIGRAIVEAMETATGVQSPSTKTAAMARNMMAGIPIGLEEGTASAVTAANVAGAEVGNAIGNSMDASAKTSTAKLETTMGGAAATVSGELAVVDTALVGTQTAMKTTGIVARISSVGVRAFGGAMALVGGPIGLIMLLLPFLLPLLKKLNDKFHITEKIMDGVKWALEKVGDAFVWLWDHAIKPGFEWLKSNWPKVLAIITGPIGIAVFLVIKYWDQILDFVKGVPDKIKNFLKGMWDMLKTGLQTVWETVKNIWARIVNWVKGRPAQFKRNLRALWNIFRTGLSLAWDKVQEIWGRIVNWVKGRPAQFMRNLRALWSIFRTGLSIAWTKVKEIWKTVTTWIKERPNQFVRNLGKLWNILKDGLSTAFTAIKNFWTNRIWPWISGLPDKVKRGLKNIFLGLANGFISAINFVGGKMQDYLFDPLNKVLSKFGVNSIKFEWTNKAKLDGFAGGGPVQGPGTGTSDSVLARVSTGEHILTAKEVQAMGGHHNVAAMRKAALQSGRLPMGDPGIFSGIAHAVSSVGGAIKKGAEWAVKWVIGKITSKVEGKNMFGDWLVDILTWAKDKFTGWGSGKDEEAAAKAAAGTGGADVLVPDPNNPSGRRSWQGGTFTNRMIAHLNKAMKIANVGIHVMQGGFRPRTSYSGTSHQGDAIDLQVSNALIKALRRVGIAAGDRTGLGNWDPHVHAVPGPKAGYGAGSAVWQWQDYVARGGKNQSLRSPWGLAQGGIVSPSPMGTLALLAEAGHHERVTPLDAEGFTPAERRMLEALENSLGGTGGGDTINVHPSQGMNEAHLADLVARRVAWKRRRGSGWR